MAVCWSPYDDIYMNLALEDLLLNSKGTGRSWLFFYRSQPSIVIGKHQNPWRECNMPAMQAAGISLARRISGGGAVYHGPGNLNYCLIMDRDAYDKDQIMAALAEAISTLGIAAAVGPRDILVAGERKFSGTAFCYRRQQVLHHGTLLLDADLGCISPLLRPTLEIEESRAIASHPFPVINLRDCRQELTEEDLVNALADALLQVCTEKACSLETPVFPAAELLHQRAEEMALWSWVIGNTPAFELVLDETNHWQQQPTTLTIRHGIIQQAEAAAELEGAALTPDALVKVAPGNTFAAALCNWMNELKLTGSTATR